MWNLVPLLGQLLDKIIPDPAAKAAAQLEVLRLAQSGELAEMEATKQLALAQIEVNKADAVGNSPMQRNWRPFIGWVGGVSLGLTYIPKAVVLSSIWTYQAIVIVHAWSGTGAPPVLPAFPDLGVTDLIGLLGSILGLATLRSAEKSKALS